MLLEEPSFNPKSRGKLNGTSKGQALSDFFSCKKTGIVFCFVYLRQA